MREGKEKGGEGKVGRDCAVLIFPLKKPLSWTLANFETDNARGCTVKV